VGEGLVGLIAAEAKALNLSDAQSHPAFAYRPETGEEVYRSFLGVPILRAGRTLGVLVVQNKAHRVYVEEEIEALQTTAMVMAEMLATGELKSLVPSGQILDVQRPIHCEGLALSEGIGLGHAVLHEPRVPVRNLIAEDAEVELKRLDEALETLRSAIDDMLDRGDLGRGEHRDVLEAYRMFAHDRGWANRMREAVQTGLTAEAAVERVQSDTRARMLRQKDPLIRERLHDLDDLANRLLRVLIGGGAAAERDAMPRDAILIARNMGPAELLDYDRERLRGVVLEEGSGTSHVAIVARALGLPLVGQVPDVVALVEGGDPVIVDGSSGHVHVRPRPEVEAAYAEKVRFRARRQAQFRALRDVAPVTLDGVPITMLMNAGLLVDLPHLDEAGAAGIGLFRTEFQFMIASAFPRMSAQRELYAKVLDAAGTRPVTFRSLDVGGDKVLPYLGTAPEENPALGWRAIRISLDRPGLLRSQLRALLQAAAGRELRLMFPMIADCGEFDQAKAVVEGEIAFLERHGHAAPRSIKLGAMVEVPSILFDLEALLSRVDFVSVGSNDLQQFLFAADRGNPRVSDRFDALSAPFLRALRRIVRAGEAAGVPVTLCGELASRPLEAMAVIGIGYRSISMSPAAFGPVKSTVLALDLGALEADLAEKLDDPVFGGSLRPALRSFADARDIPV